jgi:carbon storage regulator
MLVLSRKESDAIVINGSIRIRVLRIKGRTIYLGIDAPQEVSILRSELEPIDGDPAEMTGRSMTGR